MPRIAAQKNSTSRANPKRTPVISSSRAFGSKSPIVDKDVQSFLALCMNAWDSYTNEERQGIIQSLPPSRRPRITTPQNAPPQDLSNNSRTNHGTSNSVESAGDPQALNIPLISANLVASDTYIKRAVARFKRDIADGYYEKTWQDKAKRAYEERRQGNFDEYLNQCAEEMFNSDAEDSERSESDVCESDEDYAVGAKEGRKKSKPSKDRLTKAQKIPSRSRRQD